MPVLELDHARVHASGRGRHVDAPPCGARVIRDREGAWVAGKSARAIGAEPQAVDPAPVGEDLDGLTRKRALLGKHDLGSAPGAPVIAGDLALDDRGVLHVVLARLTAALGGIQTPDLILGREKQRRVLIGELVVGRDHRRLAPLVRALLKARDHDVDVRIALEFLFVLP